MTKKDEAVAFDESTASQFGGDYAVMRTVPRRHPKTGRPLAQTRAEQTDPSLVSYLMRGDFVFKPLPAAEIQLTWWDDDGSPTSQRHYRTLVTKKGYKEANAEEWYIAPDLRTTYFEQDGRIVRRLSRNAVSYLMVRSKERLAQDEHEERAFMMRQIEKNRDSKLAETLSGHRGIGLMPTEIEVEKVQVSTRDAEEEGEES